MLSLRRRSTTKPGWVACAPQGAMASWALVRPAGAGQLPAVQWTALEPFGDTDAGRRALGHLARQAAAAHRRVLLLPRAEYRLTTLDAPADVPRAEWAAAVRWQLKDAVDFPVDSAAIDVLAVPEGTSYRNTVQLIAVSAPEAGVAPLVAMAHDAGLSWSAVDVAETALRNLSALDEPEGRAQALLHCQDSHSTLVVTFGGELLAARQLELTIGQLAGEDSTARRHAYDHAVLELQRTLDGIERSFGQVTLARLLVAPMPNLDPLIEHLRPLLYVPVARLPVETLVDLQAVPQLLADERLLNRSLCAIGAALRDD